MSSTPIKNLHNDKRGAIMVMGLCMSCVLIGALWFIIGIGDAIVFRDTMQEATDSATFTSATLHAKGMNFISACNLIILALIAIHLIMGIIHDILLAICIISLGFGCGAWVSWRKVYTAYSRIFKPIAGAIHYAEVAASFGYPLLGAYKGYTTGTDYGSFGPKKRAIKMIVVSPSLIPGNGLTALLNAGFAKAGVPGLKSDVKDAKLGLPVSGMTFGDTCSLIGKQAFNALFSVSGHGGGAAVDMVKGWLGGLLKVRYCNDLGSTTPDVLDHFTQGTEAIDSANTKNAGKKDAKTLEKPPTPSGGGGGEGDGSCLKDGSTIDPGLDKWWGCAGPLVPWNGTSNGSPWNEVWGINFRPEFTDAQEHAVAIGTRKYGIQSTAKTNTYFSEAEFYFDCNKDWGDVDCNKDNNAGFSIQWRARLKRLQFPEIGTLITQFAGPFLTSLQKYKDFQNKITDLTKITGKDGKVITAPGGGGNPLVTGSFDGIIAAIVNRYNSEVQGDIGGLGKYMDPKLGAYH